MTQFDYAVIGGGMAGISVAAELGRFHKVLVLEREPHLAYHTTGRSAAIYSETYGNHSIRALSSASRKFFENPPEGFSAHPLLSPRPCLYIGREEQREEVARAVDDSRADPSPLELLDAAAVYRRVPLLRPGYVAVGALERGSADMDVHALHYGFQRQALAHGIEIRRDVQLLSLEREAAQWALVVAAASAGAGDTATIRYQARVVINAAGAWADEVACLAGARPVGLTPLRRTVILIPGPDSGAAADWPAVMDIGETFYFKPEGRKLLASPADETPSPPCDAQPEELDIAVCVDRIERALDLPVARIERSWAGLRTFAPDRTPVVGFDTELAGFFWLAGQGGYGIQTAPALAVLAATLARGEPIPHELLEFGVDPSVLSPARLQRSRGA
jgi:D-arginine dehydrogenase